MESLVPVIVGGIIGLAGGIVGPPLAHWLNEESSNRKKRAEKLEEMLSCIYAHDHWLSVVQSIRVFGAQDTQEPAPLPKAKAIAAIYFPQFISSLSELDAVGSHYELWMFKAAKKRLSGNINGIGEGQIEARRPYRQKREEVLDNLRMFAASEFSTSLVPWKRFKKAG
ncbi:hypothetical protein [Parasphingorhabdus sp.]|uniref:hypothetical protein n=1 Tax=Parasphingorhabdus sp. TaxID=2709688 RepID=UPI002F923927